MNEMDQGFVAALSNAGLLPMAFQTVTALLSLLCSFFMYHLFKEFDSLKAEQKKLSDRCPINHSASALELASFKTQVSNDYAKISTMSRLHERIDGMYGILLELKEKSK